MSRLSEERLPVAVPRAVVFDLDGLMFNTEDLYQFVGSEILGRRDCELTGELLDQIMGRPGHVALQMMIDFHGLAVTVPELVVESEQIFAEILESRLQLMPGLVELLAALEAAAMPKAIATSSSREFVTNVLGQFDLESRFAFVLTSEDVTQGKPDPQIYLKAAARLQVLPGEMLVLEDSQNGCRAAVAAGAIAVAVPSGHSQRHDFTGATLVADSLADERLYALLGL